jgi:hypothetical protein
MRLSDEQLHRIVNSPTKDTPIRNMAAEILELRRNVAALHAANKAMRNEAEAKTETALGIVDNMTELLDLRRQNAELVAKCNGFEDENAELLERCKGLEKAAELARALIDHKAVLSMNACAYAAEQRPRPKYTFDIFGDAKEIAYSEAARVVRRIAFMFETALNGESANEAR